jgi:hypothetical protein
MKPVSIHKMLRYIFAPVAGQKIKLQKRTLKWKFAYGLPRDAFSNKILA